MKVLCCSLLLFVTTLMGCFLTNAAQIDPTFGFVEVMLNETSFEYQKPYDTPLEKRYSYAYGTHRFWVYADDKPHRLGSNTQPRTEIRIHAKFQIYTIPILDILEMPVPSTTDMPDYTSGIWQFEGMAFIPNGTSGATIVQIHGAAHGNTTILLRIYDGDMRYYSTPVIDTGLYDKWFKVNLIHDVDGGKVTVFIDNQERLNMHDQGPGLLHFKFGVYGAPRDISYYMESRWKAIKIYKKC